MHITDWKTHKEKLLKSPGVKHALKEYRIEYEIARALIQARMRKGMTQEVLAKKLHTKQSVISRVENAKTTPTISFLKRLADILEAPLHIQFGQ